MTQVVIQTFLVICLYNEVWKWYKWCSGSLGDSPSGSQVIVVQVIIVSTGKPPNTGYMRLNVNPNDKTTPYMDIVERTGSGIYDVELKTRLGDLSGVNGTRNVPSGFEGFGLIGGLLSGSQIKLSSTNIFTR